MLVWTVPVDSASRGVCLLVEWEQTFTFIALEPPLMCLAWKILITFGCDVNRKGAFPKISFISELSFEL